jgi:hypothetical protein
MNSLDGGILKVLEYSFPSLIRECWRGLYFGEMAESSNATVSNIHGTGWSYGVA